MMSCCLIVFITMVTQFYGFLLYSCVHGWWGGVQVAGRSLARGIWRRTSTFTGWSVHSIILLRMSNLHCKCRSHGNSLKCQSHYFSFELLFVYHIRVQFWWVEEWQLLYVFVLVPKQLPEYKYTVVHVYESENTHKCSAVFQFDLQKTYFRQLNFTRSESGNWQKVTKIWRSFV